MRVARPPHDGLEPRFGGVHRSPLRVPSGRTLLEEARAAPEVASPHRQLRFEAEQLRARVRSELPAIGGERLDGRARAREPPQVEVEVREVEQGLLHAAAAEPSPHVDRGLQVRERRGEVSLGLREPGEVQPRRRVGPRVARGFCCGQRLLVRALRLGGSPGALVDDRQRAERHRFRALVPDARRERHGLLDRLQRLLVLAREREREPAHAQRVGRQRILSLGDDLGRQRESLRILSGAQMHPASHGLPRSLERRPRGVARDRVEQLRRRLRLSSCEHDARARRSDANPLLRITRRPHRLDHRERLVEPPSLEREIDRAHRLGSIERLRRGARARRREHRVDVLGRDDGSPARLPHERAQGAGAPQESLEQVGA